MLPGFRVARPGMKGGRFYRCKTNAYTATFPLRSERHLKMKTFFSVAAVALIFSVASVLFSSKHIERNQVADKNQVPQRSQNVERTQIVPEVPLPSGSQDVATALGSGAVDAVKLQDLCRRFPNEVRASLRNRFFQVNGTLLKVEASGVDAKKAKLTFEGEGLPHVVVVIDLALHEIAFERSVKKEKVRWAVYEDRLYWISEERGRPALTLAFTEGQPLSLDCKFDSWSSSNTLLFSCRYTR